MNGVANSMGVGGTVYPSPEYKGMPSPSGARGALATAKAAVRQALGNSGFVDLTGQGQENLKVILDFKPVEIETDDLKPGVLAELSSWAASQIAGNPERAEQVQARVRPDAAVKLLTQRT